ncbi:predicted protein [Histoplasma capsulatum var. duboisii H88]|uniref:Predicted protein n=1 Tax=Ajellomyces capsulatus (strain H88) TaxID=544711 RepID=F0UQZ1_AJEC8|nr:predicted protein [Histoplasma capsulatum var. duboisii H88]
MHTQYALTVASCAPLTDSALFKPHSGSVHFGLGIELSKAFESVYVLNGPSSSHVPYPLDLDNNSPMHSRTMEEIQELVVKYTTAVRRTVEAGFDGVEIHA